MPEAADVIVVYADGLFDILNLGANVAMTFFAWERNGTGEVTRAPILRLVMPKSALDLKSVADAAEAQPAPIEAAG